MENDLQVFVIRDFDYPLLQRNGFTLHLNYPKVAAQLTNPPVCIFAQNSLQY